MYPFPLGTDYPTMRSLTLLQALNEARMDLRKDPDNENLKEVVHLQEVQLARFDIENGYFPPHYDTSKRLRRSLGIDPAPEGHRSFKP